MVGTTACDWVLVRPLSRLGFEGNYLFQHYAPHFRSVGFDTIHALYFILTRLSSRVYCTSMLHGSNYHPFVRLTGWTSFSTCDLFGRPTADTSRK